MQLLRGCFVYKHKTLSSMVWVKCPYQSIRKLVCNVLHSNWVLNLVFSNPRAVWLTMWRLKAPIFNEWHTWCLMKLTECLTWDLVGIFLLHVFLLNGPDPEFYSHVKFRTTGWKYLSTVFTDHTLWRDLHAQNCYSSLFLSSYITISFFSPGEISNIFL